MLRINQLKLPLAATTAEIKSAAAAKLRIKSEEISELIIVKRSVDARKKDNVHYSYCVDVSIKNEAKKVAMFKDGSVTFSTDVKYHRPHNEQSIGLSQRPVIIGAGPAGLFCAYQLALEGFCPIIIERGSTVEKRTKAVDAFWNGEQPLSHTNVQFGEGGAGTFSDGKLNTMVKDTYGRIKYVLETFRNFGADEEITYINKPHIGTDVLKSVIVNMRQEIIKLGGEFLFDTQVIGFEKHNDRIRSISTDTGMTIKCSVLVIAIGHSARDTFEVLKDLLDMQQKPFAVGVRVEHPQSLINESQYGIFADKLPAADYKLTHTCSDGKGVYSFCMCPGGYVVNASSEDKRLVVNGMSYHDRSSLNANSAIVVSVDAGDYDPEGSGDVLAGMKYQRKLEGLAYREGNGAIPVSLYGDFKNETVSTSFGKISSIHKGAIAFADLHKVLPGNICKDLIEGIEAFGSKIFGFNDPDTVMLGVETRTSCPVRMVRDNITLESNIKGVYPCGEGAGYAGGITSAAIDGIKVAECIIKKYIKEY